MPQGEPIFDPAQAAAKNARASQAAAQYSASLTPAQRAAIGNPYPAANMPKDAQGNATYILPYPGAPHDGGPQDLANTQAILQQEERANSIQYTADHQPTFLDKLIPALAIGAATAGIGSGVGGAIGDALGSTAVGSIAGGATAGGLGAAVQGQNPLKGTLLGGITGGLSSAASPVTGALTNAGLSPALASGLVRGVIGSGVGAIGGALNGNAGNGALVGGVAGAANGLVGGATGSSGAGNLAGTAGGILAGKYLTPTPSPAPVTPKPAPVAAATPSALPTLPGQSAPPALAPPGSMGSTNIGSYSGYGYQPRQEANMSGTDWATYGQGPEQQFFQPR
jgi:hypothetical protein